MHKIIFLWFAYIVCINMVYANSKKNNNLEVSAKEVKETNTTLHAKGGAIIYYQDMIIRADDVLYNKKEHHLIADGNVEMIGYQGTKEHTSHMEIDTQSSKVHFKELFFTNENDIWLLTNKANRKEGNYTFGSSMLSSCEIENPLWVMRFSQSLYDSKERYMEVYNPKVYFNDIPIFYFPYLAFSIDNRRSSGLLFPRFDYFRKQGFLYEQPVFWAINESMDIEFNPQIRTNRSLGVYATYRFADSPHSSGQLRIGYFKDNTSYVKKNGLSEDKHYGLEFLYDSSKVFNQYFSKDYTDGLYMNTTFLNDIDYLNLQKTTRLKHFGQVPLQESRLNYFLYNDIWYGGLNAKYFIDTRLENNDGTVQILPSLQVHKYLKSFFWDHLTYSVDVQTKRLDRKTGSTLNQVELNIPLEVNFALLDDFVNISLGESFSFGQFFFKNDNTLESPYLHRNTNTHLVKLFSDLTKKYTDFAHIVQPSIYYIKPEKESQRLASSLSKMLKDTYSMDDNIQSDIQELFFIELPEERAIFSLNQYFYDKTMTLIFFQRLSQGYYPNKDYHFSNIQNEMRYYWNQWQFYNNISYSYQYKNISESSTSVSFDENYYHMSFGHIYKKYNELLNQSVVSNDLNINFTYDYNDHFSYSGKIIYSLKEVQNKLWDISASYKEDCWSVTVRAHTNILPQPISIGKNLDRQEYGFSAQFNFAPFASF
ncbi:MAG: LPS-assembly protein LptD [Sulfurovum sp.]|nr:LPS-assembly protein LptD [Sulfurovum sp.]